VRHIGNANVMRDLGMFRLDLHGSDPGVLRKPCRHYHRSPLHHVVDGLRGDVHHRSGNNDVGFDLPSLRPRNRRRCILGVSFKRSGIRPFRDGFDVALLDIKLGSGDGLTLLEQVTARAPRLKVIMMTAYPTVASLKQAFSKGAMRYLTKPVDLQELTEALRLLV